MTSPILGNSSKEPGVIMSKPSTPDIYDRIRPLMCSITSSLGESSGFFLRKGTVATVAHNIPFNQTDFVQMIHQSEPETPHFPTFTPALNVENAKTLDMVLFATDIAVDEAALLPLLPEEVPLREGMKVYFAGCPLGHEKITFHDGKISSLTKEAGFVEFTIDGTVVAGNSGGPVVTLHEGNLYLVGMITSEMADFSPQDLDTITIITQLNRINQAIPKTDYNMPGAQIQDSRGTGTIVPVMTKDGAKNVTLYDREITAMAVDLIQRNLSTGIGKALDLRCYRQLITPTRVLKEEEGPYFFPTKGKGLIDGFTVTEDKKEFLKYIEIRFGKGKGPRGIRVTMSDGSGSYRYKFSPNPHTAEGNYNKNQRELYGNAGVAFGNHLLAHKKIPADFSFEACQGHYTATQY